MPKTVLFFITCIEWCNIFSLLGSAKGLLGFFHFSTQKKQDFLLPDHLHFSFLGMWLSGQPTKTHVNTFHATSLRIIVRQ